MGLAGPLLAAGCLALLNPTGHRQPAVIRKAQLMPGRGLIRVSVLLLQGGGLPYVFLVCVCFAEAQLIAGSSYITNQSTVTINRLISLHDTQGGGLPDVVLVRKSYEEKRRRRRAKGQQRAWKLKRLAVDAGGEDEVRCCAVPGGFRILTI